MQCELCGKKIEEPYVILLEGSEVKVCKDCSVYGKIKKKPLEKKSFKKTNKPLRVEESKVELVEEIVFDYDKKLKNAIFKENQKLEVLAKKLNMKESELRALESGHRKPSIETARKLEKYFKIKLVEIIELGKEKIPLKEKNVSSTLTIGDLIKVRKRKK